MKKKNMLTIIADDDRRTRNSRDFIDKNFPGKFHFMISIHRSLLSDDPCSSYVNKEYFNIIKFLLVADFQFQEKDKTYQG